MKLDRNGDDGPIAAGVLSQYLNVGGVRIVLIVRIWFPEENPRPIT